MSNIMYRPTNDPADAKDHSLTTYYHESKEGKTWDQVLREPTTRLCAPTEYSEEAIEERIKMECDAIISERKRKCMQGTADCKVRHPEAEKAEIERQVLTQILNDLQAHNRTSSPCPIPSFLSPEELKKEIKQEIEKARLNESKHQQVPPNDPIAGVGAKE
ncbi:hypothetical protein BLNAU_16246 [Blattamonas nauphoetae]|uniref:Uncharacterized protein n=1 Tax=Blattamonas nauphoetae TaxID=2049346 RepID=A0ABQ9XA55_9EUKA|nr:hypothetical protein BLNAU_16246 [Blattamonas nauphoetae]